jgi:hypothetical protein
VADHEGAAQPIKLGHHQDITVADIRSASSSCSRRYAGDLLPEHPLTVADLKLPMVSLEARPLLQH